MPLFSAFTPFGQLEFSSKPSVAENIYRSMVSALGDAYDLTPGGHNEASLYARARSIARAKQTLRRAANNALPMKCVELLPLQEAGYGLVPNETATILQRQTLLAARMQLSRGATRENVETQLSAILGSNFIKYRTLAPGEVIAWPVDPSAGPGTYSRVDGVVVPKYLKFVDPVALAGNPAAIAARRVHYTSLDPANVGFTSLVAGDVISVQIENLGQAERLTVSAVGSDSQGLWFSAPFTKSHDPGASILVGNVPIWWSTQRFALIVVASTAALNSELHRQVDDLMSRVARGVSQWAVVRPSSPGATTIGPFALGLSPLGITTIGTVTI